jgi:type I restriction enzyme M protein
MFDESDPQGTYDPLYVDAVVSNPPYSQEWDPTDQENDPRYAPFGVAPKGCADYAFLLHDLYHVKPSGIMTIVLPHGVLYRGGSEYQIRKQLVEYNHIDAIIGLPEKVFYGTSISTIVMVLKRKTRVDDKILFIDASAGFEKDGKNNRLRACDIKKAVDAVTTRTETSDFARLVSRGIIRQNDYNLNIPRYVDTYEEEAEIDIPAVQKEIEQLEGELAEVQTKMKEYLKQLGY